jgi:hypothetical protein
MSRFLRSSKSIYDLFELYIPGHHILNRIPNNLYKDHYVFQDLLRGVRAVKFTENDMCCHSGCYNCKIECENILDYKVEDILAMRLHPTYYSTYHLEDDKSAAKHLFNILEFS